MITLLSSRLFMMDPTTLCCVSETRSHLAREVGPILMILPFPILAPNPRSVFQKVLQSSGADFQNSSLLGSQPIISNHQECIYNSSDLLA